MMYNKMLCNENVLVSHVAKRALYNVNDVLRHNRVVLHHKYGLPDANGIYIFFDVEWPADDLHRADLITELLSARGVQSVEMTQADTQDILEYVCTYYNILPVFAIVRIHMFCFPCLLHQVIVTILPCCYK